jgi:hypothetical protein
MRSLTAIVSAALVGLLVAAGIAPAQSPAPARTYSPGVADIMIATQMRHAKLWLAGDARNWDLAEYQIGELKEGLEDIVKYFPVYKDVPIGQMIEATVMTPLAEVEAAIKTRDRTRFGSTFDKLTAACNTCHESSNRPFIVIQRPANSAFPNQSFAPKK